MDWIITNCQAAINANGEVVLSLFLVGLFTGFSHCAAMCGPFILLQLPGGQAQLSPSSRAPFIHKIAGSLALPYHLGRATTYIMLGVIGGAGSQYLFGGTSRTIAAIALIMLALILVSKVAYPGAGQRRGARPFHTLSGRIGRGVTRFITAVTRRISHQNTVSARYGLGLVLGLLPCGVLYGVLFVASAVAEPFGAGLAVGAFALGTMLALIPVGLGGQALQRRWPSPFSKIKRGLYAVNGTALLILGGGMLL